MGSAYHTIHHTKYDYNYGQLFIFFDYIHETLLPPSHRIHDGWSVPPQAITEGRVSRTDLRIAAARKAADIIAEERAEADRRVAAERDAADRRVAQVREGAALRARGAGAGGNGGSDLVAAEGAGVAAERAAADRRVAEARQAADFGDIAAGGARHKAE